MRSYYILFAFLITLIACQSNTATSNLKPTDLLEYGIPITIMAPDSIAVKTGNLGFSKDVTIKGEEAGFDLQIFAHNATSTDINKVKQEQLEEIKSNRYFSKIVQEDPDGFIYEMALDSTNLNYGFKYLRLQGDKEYTFQTAMVGTFTLEEAKGMYEAVRQQKE